MPFWGDRYGVMEGWRTGGFGGQRRGGVFNPINATIARGRYSTLRRNLGNKTARSYQAGAVRRMMASPTDFWIGASSKKSFSRVGWNIDRAISGRGNRVRWTSSALHGTPGPYALSGAKRARAIGRAGDHLLAGLSHLPRKTKIAVPLLIGGALIHHSRKNKSKFYTHYFDY